MYVFIAKPLEFFYGLYPNYAVAISLLTLSIMILLLPLTLKGTRSMLAMQKLQPELKKIQNKYKDDRQKLNEEMMAFYKENNINPVSGCLPLLLQMPVFIILYRTLFQLLNRAPYGYDMGAASVRSTTGFNGGASGAGAVPSVRSVGRVQWPTSVPFATARAPYARAYRSNSCCDQS